MITNSHQSVQIPVNSFHIRRFNCYWGGGGGVLILVDVENWLDNARMYNGYLKINKKKKMNLIAKLSLLVLAA